MNRRLRKHPQQHAGQSDRETGHTSSGKFPFGLMWIVLTALVLVLVVWYDRRGIGKAEAHIADGKELETKGLYVEALNEYRDAFTNNRLGRKAKGSVALAMAEIYFKNMEDYPEANRYYVYARQLAPGLLADKGLQQRTQEASSRAEQSGSFIKKKITGESGVTTQTIVQRVELLKTPGSDLEGPVVANYNGGEIHAGQLLRALEKRPEFLRPDFREDPLKLKGFLDGLLKEQLAYEAAISTGIHKDPDVTERLYDYQKSLVIQRYMIDRREQALVVDNADIEKYYREHLSEYVQPAQIEVAVIKSDSETSAAEYLQMLRDGRSFYDVATSYSQHKESAGNGGNIGVIKEKDTTLPGIAEGPHIIDALFKLPVMSVTEVTPFEGSFYIFKVISSKQARNETLEEARPRIQNVLRGRSVDQARTGLDEQLQNAFKPEVNETNLQKFWDFAVAAGGVEAGTTTGSVERVRGTTATEQFTTGSEAAAN